MAQIIEHLPLFPLTAHVLPGGRLPLRIFEPRYLRMVRESYHRDYAFGMCMMNMAGSPEDNTHVHPIGTLITIIDFAELPDGMLGITVEGKQCFSINHIETEEDELCVGNVELLPIWPPQILNKQQLFLAENLKELMHREPNLSHLYPDADFNNGSWVALRWLEIIPIHSSNKQNLLSNSTASEAINYLQSLFQQDNIYA